MKMINLLIDSGVDVNLPDGCGKVALVEAVKKENMKIVSILIKNGSDVKAFINASAFTPFYFQKFDVARLLIDWGAEVNLVDNYGTSLIVSSIKYNRLEIVSLLIDRGVNTNVKSRNGMSLSLQHLAAFDGNYDMIQLLTVNCAKTLKDKKGNYPIEAIMRRMKMHTFKKILLLQTIKR